MYHDVSTEAEGEIVFSKISNKKKIELVGKLFIFIKLYDMKVSAEVCDLTAFKTIFIFNVAPSLGTHNLWINEGV